MNYNIESLEFFDKQLKRLVKKYPSLKEEFANVVRTLTVKPDHGTFIGDNSYKIRLGISSKGKGKSGGARIITHVRIVESTVYLLTIYDKSEQENLPQKQLDELVKLTFRNR